MPGVAALPLKKIFTFSLVFDMRGLWADEKVDRLGWRKDQFKYTIKSILGPTIYTIDFYNRGTTTSAFGGKWSGTCF